jgi:hypothetical protein
MAMKIAILEDSETKLKIRLTPIYLAAYLLSGVLGVVGGWLVLKLLAVTITISIDGGKLDYQRAFLGKSITAQHSVAVAEIQEVSVKIPDDSGSYEIVVTTDVRSFNMPLVSEGWQGKERIAGEIRNALTAPGGRYRFEDGSLMLGLALGIVVIAGGVFCLALIQTSGVDVDRAGGRLTIKRRLWFLPFVRSSTTLEVGDVGEVQLRSFTVRGRTGPVESFSVVVTTAGYGDIPVAYGPMFRWEDAKTLKHILEKAQRPKRPKRKR